MATQIEEPPSRKTHTTEASEHAFLDVSSPPCVWDESKVRTGFPEDQAVFRQWRRGFFIFYGATILLLGGVGFIADRTGAHTRVTAQANPAIASADTIRHPHKSLIGSD
jgi:hypothetical protein